MAEVNGLTEADKEALAEIGKWADRIISGSVANVTGLSAFRPAGSTQASITVPAIVTGTLGTPVGSTWENIPTASSLISSLAPQTSSAGGILEKLVSPLIGGLMGLFGGFSEPEADAFIPFEMPAPLSWNLGIGGQQGGMPRLVDYDSEGNGRQGGSAGAPVTQPITIQVQTLDSRSFQDHSKEIADAVQRALLESHNLNDTLRGLDLS